MKKIALFLAILTAFSVSASALSLETVETVTPATVDAELHAEAEPKVYFVEDFEDARFEVDKAYTGVEFSELCKNADGAFGTMTGTGHSTFTVREEANGNKYLEITGQDYYSFGYNFGDGAEHLAAFACNYKYPTAEGGKGLTSAAYHKTHGVLSGSWQDWTAVVTNTANTEWTYMVNDNIAATHSIGLGFSTVAGTATVLIDDVRIYTTAEDTDRGTAWSVKAPAEVAFDAGTKHGLDVSGLVMHDAVEKNIFYHNDVENSSIDLSGIEPLDAPLGYTFAGWSLTDGGDVIKAHEYSAYKVHGDMTLYAVWEEDPDSVGKETVYIEFVNTTYINATLPAMVKAFKGEAFDLTKYKATYDDPLYEFRGWSLEEGGEALTELVPTEEYIILFPVWGLMDEGYTKSEDFQSMTVGASIGAQDDLFTPGNLHASVNWTFENGTVAKEGDNLYMVIKDSGVTEERKAPYVQTPGGYWYENYNEAYGYPVGVTSFKTNKKLLFNGTGYITFKYRMPEGVTSRAVVYRGKADDANLAGGASLVQVITYLEPTTEWTEVTIKHDNTVQLGVYLDGKTTDGKKIEGFDGGEMHIDDYTYTYDSAVYVEDYAMTGLTQLRFDAYAGIRFVSLIDCAAAEKASDYGFVVTLDKFLRDIDGSVDLAYDGLTVTTPVQKVVEYGKKNGAETVYEAEDNAVLGVTAGKNKAISALITGIPATAYEEIVVIRPFVTLGGVAFYGTPAAISYKQAAQRYADADYAGLTPEQTEIVKSILAA